MKNKKPHFIIVLLALFFLFVLPQTSQAANHYIRSDAAGANNGNDWTNAWTSLPSTLIRGDSYFIADGTYGQYTFDDAVDGTNRIYIKKATQANHGIDAGWNSLMGDGQAVFTWIGGSGTGSVLTIKTSYYEIDGQVGGGPSSWTSGHGFKVTTDNPQATLVNITHNGNGTAVAGNIHIYRTELAHVGRLQNPYATGTYGPLAIQSKPTGGSASAGDHHFAYNYIHDSPAMLMWGYETGSFILEYNYFDTSAALEGGSTVQGSGITTYASNSQVYRYNTFKDMKGSCGICLYTWHGDFTVNDIKIYGNVFFYSDSFAAEGNQVQNGIIASDGCSTNCNSDRVSNVVIYNNTFANIKGYKAFYISDGSSSNYIKNNIIYQCKGVPISDGDFSTFVHDHNWFYGNTDYRNGNHLDSNWAASDNNSQIGIQSPFVDSDSFDFHLSLPTNQGDNTIGVTYNTDLAGLTRGLDGVWDLGAHEYVSITPDTTPPTQPTDLTVR